MKMDIIPRRFRVLAVAIVLAASPRLAQLKPVTQRPTRTSPVSPNLQS